MALCNPCRINSYKTTHPQPPVESIDPGNRGVGVLRVSKQLPLLRLWQSFQHVSDGSGANFGSTATLGCALWRLVTLPKQLLTRTGSLRLSGQAIACATRGARPPGQYCAYARVDTARPWDIYEARRSRSGLCSAGLQPGILSAVSGLAHTFMNLSETREMRDSSARSVPRNDNILRFSAGWLEAAEKIGCLGTAATGTFFGALKRSSPRINAGAPTRKGLKLDRVRFPIPVGAPCFSRGKLDFSPAEERSLLKRLSAAGGCVWRFALTRP
jgi:hypothetical protein